MTTRVLATSHDIDLIISNLQGQTQKFVYLYINEKLLVNQLPLEPIIGSDFLGAALAILLLSVSTQIPLAMAASF